MANAVPDSRIPRKFIAVSTTIAATAKLTLWVATKGSAEPIFEAAEEIDTALDTATEHTMQLATALNSPPSPGIWCDLNRETTVALLALRNDLRLFAVAAIHTGFHDVYGAIDEQVDFRSLDREIFGDVVTVLIRDPTFQQELVDLAKQKLLDAYPDS